jgi:phage repressor protein C with HTH and peptisase S24 domain
MPATLADRLKARARQLGMNAREVAEYAGVNRSFVYDIMRGRSEHPNSAKLQKVAQALDVGERWLAHGLGHVGGEAPVVEDPMRSFVRIPAVNVTPTMGGGALVADEDADGLPYHFQRGWIVHELKANPANLRILHVEGDSMRPTLHPGDIVLVDLARTAPTPPGIFVLHDGIGLVAKRLEHIPNHDPPRVRVISDNTFYHPYERSAEEVNIIGRIRWFAREI